MTEGRKKFDKIYATIASKVKLEHLMDKLMVDTALELLKEKEVLDLAHLRLSDDMYLRVILNLNCSMKDKIS